MGTDQLEDRYQFRESLVSDLEADLVGPASPDETITDPPITKYIVGVLYPQSAEQVDPAQEDGFEDHGDEATAPDPGVSLSNVRYPSSMGLTFAVDPAVCRRLEVRIRCGRYEEETVEPRQSMPSRGKAKDESRVWHRVDIGRTLQVELGEDGLESRQSVVQGLELYCRARASGGTLAVTLALINTNHAPIGSVEKDGSSFFQASIQASGVDGTQGAFIGRTPPGLTNDDADLRSYSLLYRHATAYAVGHGCSATWVIGQGETDYVATTCIPSQEVRLAVSNPAISLACLSLEFLAGGDRAAVIAALMELPEAYRAWIVDQRSGRQWGPFGATATEHLAGCSSVADRIEAGIHLLATDDRAWEAFRLASDAMLTVRARGDWHRKGRPPDGPDRMRQSWYPFQLGFLLLCIGGVADPRTPEREVVDLLWFPTGGGKTEAYLGLVAFTVFLRRLKRGESGAGVTALMRYTLRLLTIQQFERAAALICASELLRRDRASQLGDVPISLGLWVGGDGTPNRRVEADLQLKKLKSGVVIDKGNPVQLKSCPWCGTKLDAWNYSFTNVRTPLAITCPDGDCPFRKGLPVYVVDEDVYEGHPTLVIATADKFAGIAWLEEAYRLFNLDLPGTPPFELVIQDELHLISGPLGTLAGLYEAAIDGTASSSGHRPKVVASSATIRRADSQSEALFARKVQQFPPPGIDSRDSFFAVEAPPQRKGTRRYVGVLAPGSSQTTLLVRTYARLLQSALGVGGSDAARDPYWTLLGYFNSLRVLGGARMQVHNDVEDRLKLLQPDEAKRRQVDKVIELTSRESSADIPGYLEQLARAIPDALDVVLATNMISVGVDVSRLGLMVVMGQPQGTAEYIQATSRVGRDHPGLVVVLLNAARSRDRSHYESFAGYHGALYRQVESSSVTPYSPRARDRALHAALIASVRMRIPGLRTNESASQIGRFVHEVRSLRDEIVARAARVAPDEREVANELDQVIERWQARAHANPRLRYRDKNPDVALLVDAAEPDHDEALGTMWSLRDVDRTSNLYLLR